MQKQGHKLALMHAAAMNELRVRTANNCQYVRGLRAEVDSDPVVVPIIEALDMHGRMGAVLLLR